MLFGHTSGMTMVVPVFRFPTAFLNRAAFGDRGFAASACCRSWSSSCHSTRRRHTSRGNVQHQHSGTQLLERTMGTLAGTDGSCGGGTQSCFEWKVGQFGRSLRYASTVSFTRKLVLDLSTQTRTAVTAADSATIDVLVVFAIFFSSSVNTEKLAISTKISNRI